MAESLSDQTPPILPEKAGLPHTSPPVTLRQGPILLEISKISTDFEMSKRFLEGLDWVRQKDVDYVDFLLSYDVIKTAGEMNHLRKHWYPKHTKENGVWWPKLQPIVDTIVDGLIEAFTIRVEDKDNYISYYWAIIGDELKYTDKASFNHVATRICMRPDDNLILLMKCTPPPGPFQQKTVQGG